MHDQGVKLKIAVRMYENMLRIDLMSGEEMMRFYVDVRGVYCELETGWPACFQLRLTPITTVKN